MLQIKYAGHRSGSPEDYIDDVEIYGERQNIKPEHYDRNLKSYFRCGLESEAADWWQSAPCNTRTSTWADVTAAFIKRFSQTPHTTGLVNAITKLRQGEFSITEYLERGTILDNQISRLESTLRTPLVHCFINGLNDADITRAINLRMTDEKPDDFDLVKRLIVSAYQLDQQAFSTPSYGAYSSGRSDSRQSEIADVVYGIFQQMASSVSGGFHGSGPKALPSNAGQSGARDPVEYTMQPMQGSSFNEYTPVNRYSGPRVYPCDTCGNDHAIPIGPNCPYTPLPRYQQAERRRARLAR